MVRPAVSDDIEALINLCLDLHGRVQTIPADRGSIEQTLLALLDSSQAAVFVLEIDGGVVGLFAGTISPVYWNHSVTVCQQLIWYVLPGAAREHSLSLMQSFERWGQLMGAMVGIACARTAPDTAPVHGLFEWFGYQELERNYSKELS